MWMRNEIEPQSLEIVQRMLNAGEINELYVANIEESIFQSLNLDHLKALSIENIPFYNFEFLSSIKGLKYLKIDLSSINSSSKYVELKTLPAMPGLESLFLAGKEIKSLNNLPAFPKLKELWLREINGESLAFLEAYPLINDMWISECHLKDYRYLVNCKNLIRLRVFETPLDFDDMNSASTLNHSLQILELYDCPTLKNLEPLVVFEKLRYLDISLCKNLRSVKGIEKCKSLEVIVIQDPVWKAIGKKIERFLLADLISIFNSNYRRRITRLRQLDSKKINYLDHYNKYFSGSLVYPPQMKTHKDSRR